MAAMTKVIERENPRILLFGHTDMGADLGPRLSFRLGTAIATDCVELSVEPDTKRLLRTKPVYGGMAMATYVSDDFPQIATVRPKSLPPAERRVTAEGPAVPIDVDLDKVTSRRQCRGKGDRRSRGDKAGGCGGHRFRWARDRKRGGLQGVRSSGKSTEGGGGWFTSCRG